MSRCAPIARPLALRLGMGMASLSLSAAPATAAGSSSSLPSSSSSASLAHSRRTLSTTAALRSPDTLDTTTTTTTSDPPPPPPPPSTPWEAFAKPSTPSRFPHSSKFEDSPDTATRPWAESRLLRRGTPPVGSRRRRVALRARANVPFEQLPFQCFQEARAFLREDRERKLVTLRGQMEKIKQMREAPLQEVARTEGQRRTKIRDMEILTETLKVWADINDPVVKRRFEDGMGDMNKPIYRHLAKRRWQKFHKLQINQRIKQFHIVPDILPGLTTKADVQLYYRQKRVEPGKILPSLVTEHAPTLRVQVFEPGTRLVTVVVVDADVPDVENDSFFHRLHFVAGNVPVDPTNKNFALSRIPPNLIAVPWLPAFAQLGSPYHRLAIILFDQRRPEPFNVASVRHRFIGGHAKRDRFNLTAFCARWGLSPFGFTMFRSVWDDDTRAVMERAGIPGADVQFKPMRIASLKPPKKVRGWEARRQGPKYKFLWKYTKRIRGLSTGKKWKGSRS